MVDARHVATSLPGHARHLYESLYCARGQAENLIKLHRAQLASDRTSCQSPVAKQVRLVLHGRCSAYATPSRLPALNQTGDGPV